MDRACESIFVSTGHLSIPDLKNFGERLAQQRREAAAALRRDITQSDVAKAANVTPGAVSRWESGDKEPRRETVELLALLLGATPAYLLFGGEPTPPTFREDVMEAWMGRGRFPISLEPVKAAKQAATVHARQQPTTRGNRVPIKRPSRGEKGA